MAADPPNQENSRDELKLLFEGYKFFVSIRFIVVAFAMSIQSALLTIYNQAVKENLFHNVIIFPLAMLFLVALAVIERRTTSLFRSLLNRGNEVEFQLGLPNGFFHRIAELSRQKGLRSFITHTWGIGLVYVGIFVLWTMLFVAAVAKSEPEPRKEQPNVINFSLFNTQR